MRSVITERTESFSNPTRPQKKEQLTSLSENNRFNLVVGKTSSSDAHIPIRFEWSAYSEKEAHRDASEKNQTAYQRIHRNFDIPSVYYAQKEEAD